MYSRSVALATLASFLFAPVAAAQAGRARPPNVVLIVTDDVGYGDIGSYGAPDVRTPSIDRIAREGVRLTDFYANGATCSRKINPHVGNGAVNIIGSGFY